jgi:hypothetical protein
MYQKTALADGNRSGQFPGHLMHFLFAFSLEELFVKQKDMKIKHLSLLEKHQ